jgi:hypothetical protein
MSGPLGPELPASGIAGNSGNSSTKKMFDEKNVRRTGAVDEMSVDQLSVDQ